MIGGTGTGVGAARSGIAIAVAIGAAVSTGSGGGGGTGASGRSLGASCHLDEEEYRSLERGRHWSVSSLTKATVVPGDFIDICKP